MSTALVNVFAVTGFDNGHDEMLIRHFVNDPVHTLPDPVTLLPGKLFTAHWPWVVLQRLHALKKTGNILVRY
ncbi:MAG: hypothetical protein WEB57_14610 [Pseudohongiellaceae bacterium]